MMTIKTTYRGWQGHFICPCRWHLNTLVESGGRKIVVSTVGQSAFTASDRKPDATGEDRWDNIGCDRKYETMTFESSYDEWDDADVTKQLDFGDGYNDERAAQAGHERIVAEVTAYLSNPANASPRPDHAD